jgi:hypothetical protein
MSGLTAVKITNPLIADFNALTQKTEDLDKKIAALLPKEKAELSQQLKPGSLEELAEKIDRLIARLREASETTGSEEGASKNIFERVRLKVLTRSSSAGQACRVLSSEGLEGIKSRLPPARYGENSLEAVIRNRKNEHNALFKELKKQMTPLIGDCALTFFPAEQKHEDLRALAEQLVAKFPATARDEEKISEVRKAYLDNVYKFLLAYMSRDNKNMETCLAFFSEKNLEALLELCKSLYRPPNFLNDIPTEIVGYIFSEFSIKELRLVAGVCRVFKQLTEHDRLWELIGKRAGLPERELEEKKIEKQRVVVLLARRKKAVEFLKSMPTNLSLHVWEGLVQRVNKWQRECIGKGNERTKQEMSIVLAAKTGEVAFLREMVSLLKMDLSEANDLVCNIVDVIKTQGYYELFSLLPIQQKEKHAVAILHAFASNGHLLSLKKLFAGVCEEKITVNINAFYRFAASTAEERAFIDTKPDKKYPFSDESNKLMRLAFGSRLALEAVVEGHLDILKWIFEEKLIEKMSPTLSLLAKHAALGGYCDILRWLDEEKLFVFSDASFCDLSQVVERGHLNVIQWLDAKRLIDKSNQTTEEGF